MQKYSSNVLEKCFDYGKEKVVNIFIKEICISEDVTSKYIIIFSNYGK